MGSSDSSFRLPNYALASPVSSSPNDLLDPLPDEQLIARTLRGHRDAFSALVRRHEQRLFRFLSRTTVNVADVEDAMQHAFVKAFTKLGTYNPKYQFTTWLFTIALRELRSLHRGSALKTTPLADHHHPPAPPVADHAPGDTWAAARRLLNPTHFTALWLRYGEDLPARDIAKIMNRPRIWVSVTLHRACATLRGVLEPTTTAPPSPKGAKNSPSPRRQTPVGEGRGEGSSSSPSTSPNPQSSIRSRQSPDTITTRGTP